eukprot:6200780-Pleurochrysis_carterae.AAC.3
MTALGTILLEERLDYEVDVRIYDSPELYTLLGDGDAARTRPRAHALAPTHTHATASPLAHALP